MTGAIALNDPTDRQRLKWERVLDNEILRLSPKVGLVVHERRFPFGCYQIPNMGAPLLKPAGS